MPDSTIDEIKRRVDLLDVISSTVDLKRSGKGFKGLCPFHSEKTPSFHVWPERGSWHCFGCGEGGDVFSFVQRRENLDFADALRLLADRAGVQLERPVAPDPAARQKRDRLRAVLESTALFYRGALLSAQGAQARSYLSERGVADSTADLFGLGYAESGGRALERHLTEAGFRLEEAVQAGALGQADDGRTYDRFRGRLIFPIRDAEGHAIGFGGRALKADQQPKYLNSPQTDLFDKSASLYGIDHSTAPIRQAGQAIVVEGYMDALVAHQYGFRNVVATLGTAITDRHIAILRRLAPEIVLALDADAAGVRAAIRGAGVASESLADESPVILRVRGLGRFFADRRTQLKVMRLPEGRDPDEVIRGDPAQWTRLVSEALRIVDFVLADLGQRHDLATSAGQREAAREAMTIIQDLPDPVERGHYIQRLARILNMSEQFLLQAAETRPRRHQPTTADRAPEPPLQPEERLQDFVLALLLRTPPDVLQPDPADFESASHRMILQRVIEGERSPDPATALEQLGQELGPPFEPTIQRLRETDEENDRLSPDELARELRVRVLELRKSRLFRQHQALDSVLREEADHLSVAEQREYQQRLAHLAVELGDIFAEQAQLGSVGSTSWSVRRGQEVLGG